MNTKLPTPLLHSPKLLVVEDDFSFALELELIIKKMGYKLIGSVDNSAAALDLIFSKEIDLILMDIDIQGNLSGLEIAQNISHLNIPIIFITSYGNEEVYQAANQTNMVNYLVKPVHPISLKSALNTAFIQSSQNIQETNNSSPEEGKEEGELFIKNALFFKKKDMFHKVNFSEIRYIQAEDKYCSTYTDKGEKFVVRVRLSDFEEWLPSHQFMRISRSYIAAINKIDKINVKDVSIHIGEKELPMSMSKFTVLQKLIFKVR